jgi:DNA-binding transcriptional MerR regulator
VSGQRRYDSTVLNQLAVLQRARRLGFTLDQIRLLFFSFPQGTRASERWQKSAQTKLAELEDLAREIEEMRRLLLRVIESCRCNTLDECGVRIRENDRVSKSRKQVPGRLLYGR